MKNSIKQIVIGIVLISISVFATYSIHPANHREYTRSEAGEFITYPKDVLLSWSEKLSAGVGGILGLIVIFSFCCLFFIGVNTFYTKYISRY